MMSEKSQVPLVGCRRSSRSQESIDWKQCILCQTDDTKKGILVQNPRITSYEHVLEIVQERANLSDGDFVNVQKRLQHSTPQTLQAHGAIWHRSCHSNATHKSKIQCARDRYTHAICTGHYSSKRRGQKRGNTELAEPDCSTSSSFSPFTRSRTTPLEQQLCFFCQENTGKQLFKISSGDAAKTLKIAVEKSRNPALKTRLCANISEEDACATDVRYHKDCWRKHVFHVVRERGTDRGTRTSQATVLQRACLLELVNLIDVETKKQAYLSMDDIETTYVNMLGSEALENHVPAFNRKWLKERILTDLPHLKSILQKDRKKSAVIYSPEACDEEMVHDAMTEDDDEKNMKAIYRVAHVIRNSIATFEKPNLKTNTIRVVSDIRDVSSELYTLIRWIMVGPAEKLETENRTRAVDQVALTVSQNIMYGFKSKRQVNYKPSSESVAFRFSHARENPQVIGLALTVHHDTRNKKLMELLNAQGHCVSYERVLHMETALANAVVENTRRFRGLYVPPFLKRGGFVFFAADNTDFAEDTPDGKGTMHGTIIAVYQKDAPSGEPIAEPLVIGEAKNLTVTPYHVDILQCDKPKPRHAKRTEQFTISKGIPLSYQLTQLGWFVANALSRMKPGRSSSKIPGWAGYNSLLSESRPLTMVGALPLLPEVAHEWSTLLTVLTQATQLRRLVVGEDHPTIITFDMSLYEKVLQLLDARPQLKKMIVPRLGELHATMAAMRGLGSSIENSGIDDAWIEADVFGASTTRQILKVTHYKRALLAHIYTSTALYEMVLELFFEDNPELKCDTVIAAEEVEAACSEVEKVKKAESVKQAHNNLLQTLTAAEVTNRFHEWEEQRSKNAMFKSMMNYLHRVEIILLFIAASRNADLELHLQAGEALSKIFFSMDRIKYKRLWPRYIADMRDLKSDYPQTWEELQTGNVSVTKSCIPFVSIGADHACEQINKTMKCNSGLKGISTNANSRERFFMAAPELSCISQNFKSQLNMGTNENAEHHELGPSAVKRAHDAVNKIKAAILSHGNPFTAEGNRLYNIITHAYISDQYVPQILNADTIGQKLYQDYVAERINGEVSIWAPVKKENNKMFISGNKETTVTLRDKTVDLKETKDLYGRLMILARSNRDINLEDAIGNYEFTLTPRALFAPNGAVLLCQNKSSLTHHLIKLAKNEEPQFECMDHQDVTEKGDGNFPCRKIALVDGMVLVQKLTKKPATVMTVKDLSVCFNDKLMSLAKDFDEIVLVFDTYRTDSLKSAAREKRRDNKAPVQYQVTDETNIKHIPMSRFLSHDKTKADLTGYLASKTLEYNMESPKLIITSASGHTGSNKGLYFEDNNHEEADTLLIYQAVLASQRNPSNSQLVFFSTDTDVLVLVTAYYDMLLKNTSVSMTSEVVHIRAVWEALGPARAKALPAFHAFTGADNTGRFSRVGKATWFQAYLQTDEDIINALQMLEEAEVTEGLLSTLAGFVCAAYAPKGIIIKTIPELRWHLFTKHMAESDKLPPTNGALKQHILRVHIQARVWGQAAIAHQDAPLDPLKNGYFKDADGRLKPTTTDVLPAPKAIMEMVKCHCKADCSSARCSCRTKNLTCTDLCQCGSQCQNDEDSQNNAHSSDDEDENDDDEDVFQYSVL